MSEQQVCAECGGTSEVIYPPGASRIQRVDIAWPGSRPFYAEVLMGDTPFMPNPNANGRHVELWLHPECEAACIERLETEMKEQQK